MDKQRIFFLNLKPLDQTGQNIQREYSDKIHFTLLKMSRDNLKVVFSYQNYIPILLIMPLRDLKIHYISVSMQLWLEICLVFDHIYYNMCLSCTIYTLYLQGQGCRSHVTKRNSSKAHTRVNVSRKGRSSTCLYPTVLPLHHNNRIHVAVCNVNDVNVLCCCGVSRSR